MGPSASCALPERLLPPLIYLYRDGELQPDTSLPLGYAVGDLAAGQSTEFVVVIAVEDHFTGRVGGLVTVRSGDDPSVRASANICWSVEEGAAAPPTNLQVTKTLLTDAGASDLEFAEYAVTISNVSGVPMRGVTLLDVQLGTAALLEANPTPTGADPLGRPTWSLGDLAPGGAITVRLVVGPQREGGCAFSDDVVVVSATPEGGAQEDYVAFADQWAEVGRCERPLPEEFCRFYPPEGEPVIALCDEEVCWATPPEGGRFFPIFECDPDAEYCWFYPPGEGEPLLSLCTDEVCWFSFEKGEFEEFFPVPCDEELCEYTSPDGTQTYEDLCDFPVCWSSPPGGDYWVPVWECGKFESPCWWSPEGGGGFVLMSCEQELDVCFGVPPEGALTIPEFNMLPCEEAEHFCWPVPEDAGQFVTYLLPCDEVEYVCWAISPGSAFGIPVECGFAFCWAPLPPDVELPPGWELPPDLLIPDECAPGQESKTGVPGTSLPVVVEPAVSTPAEVVEGTVETVLPEPSSSTSPAEVVPSVRVVPIGPRPPDGPEAPGGQEDGRSPPRPDRSRGERPDLLDVLGISHPPSQSGGPSVTSLPQSGASFEDNGVALRRWLLVAALLGGGLAAVATGVRLRERWE